MDHLLSEWFYDLKWTADYKISGYYDHGSVGEIFWNFCQIPVAKLVR